MSRSQFQSKRFILRHAWLNLWDERMTTGRINQIAIFRTPDFYGLDQVERTGTIWTELTGPNKSYQITFHFILLVFQLRPIQKKPLHPREGIVTATRQNSQVLHHHQLSILPEQVVGQVDTKTTSRFGCQQRQVHKSQLPRHKETLGAFWDRFEQILVTNARLRWNIHSQSQTNLGPIRLVKCNIWVTRQLRSSLDHGQVNERYRKDYM